VLRTHSDFPICDLFAAAFTALASSRPKRAPIRTSLAESDNSGRFTPSFCRAPRLCRYAKELQGEPVQPKRGKPPLFPRAFRQRHSKNQIRLSRPHADQHKLCRASKPERPPFQPQVHSINAWLVAQTGKPQSRNCPVCGRTQLLQGSQHD